MLKVPVVQFTIGGATGQASVGPGYGHSTCRLAANIQYPPLRPASGADRASEYRSIDALPIALTQDAGRHETALVTVRTALARTSVARARTLSLGVSGPSSSNESLS